MLPLAGRSRWWGEPGRSSGLSGWDTDRGTRTRGRDGVSGVDLAGTGVDLNSCARDFF